MGTIKLYLTEWSPRYEWYNEKYHTRANEYGRIAMYLIIPSAILLVPSLFISLSFIVLVLLPIIIGYFFAGMAAGFKLADKIARSDGH